MARFNIKWGSRLPRRSRNRNHWYTTNVDTPVDGGIVTVTALAIGYGVRQARKRKEDKNNENGAV
jgi:hypothetical protein